MIRPSRSMELLLVSALLAGCSTVDPPPPQAPYFVADADSLRALQGLLRKENPPAAKCASKNTCDHVFFTRALAALYESRDSAIHYFEKVIAVAPKSQLAVSSRLWLQLLRAGAVPADQAWLRSVLVGPATARTHTVLSQTIERTVFDLLNRELTIQQLRAMQDIEAQSIENLQRELHDQERKAEVFNSRRDASRTSTEPGVVQSLQRQIGDRDKKIEELTNQLEALKRIDQEMRGKTRQIKPPSNVPPLQPSEPSKP